MSTQTLEDMNYLERVEHYREDVPDDLCETYDHLLGQGCAPRIAAGTCYYIYYLQRNVPITQTEITDHYGFNNVTLRRWAHDAWEEHTGEEWDRSVTNKPNTDSSDTDTSSTDTSTSDTSDTNTSNTRAEPEPEQPYRSTIRRDVFHTIYNADPPFLSTSEVADRAGYTREQIRQPLRDLANMGAVGSRGRTGSPSGEKEWWAATRSDTPEHSYQKRGDTPSVEATVRELASIRDWEEATYSSGGLEGEYRIGAGYGSSASVRKSGWEDLTDETDPILQIIELVEEYDIDIESEMNIQFSLNKPGLRKVLDAEREQGQEADE